MYILDTNTVIYFFKGMGAVGENLLKQAPKSIGIPEIVLFELEVGIAKSTSPHKRIKQLAAITSAVNTVPFGAAEARAAANIRTDLETDGSPIGPYDVLIAATALANEHTLVTHNLKEFGRIPRLQIEDWY